MRLSLRPLGPGGAKRCDPAAAGSVRLKGLCPWAAGTKSMPLPTATHVEPLRGSEGEDAGRQGGIQVTDFEAAPLIKPPALRRASYWSLVTCSLRSKASLVYNDVIEASFLTGRASK